MPAVTLEIRVSRREADRPRLLQLTAFDAAGGREGVAVSVTVDESGTLHEESELRSRELVTGSQGIALFQWFEWPRNGPARDFTSIVTATWSDDSVQLYLEDLYE